MRFNNMRAFCVSVSAPLVARFGTKRRVQPRSRPVEPRRRAAGFTMIEVLVALAIIAIALGASLRAVGSLASNSARLHERMLAGWSADNALTTITLEHQWPEMGTSVVACPQGDLDLRCSITIRSTPNPLFRQAEVVVRRANSDEVLANITTVIPNETRRSL